jgi:hypothetical protein
LQCRTHHQKVFKGVETIIKKSKKEKAKSPLPCAEDILKQAPIYIPALHCPPQYAKLAVPDYPSMVFSKLSPPFHWQPRQ